MVCYVCEVCDEKFHVLNMIFRHMEKNHDTKKSNICCDKSNPEMFKYKPSFYKTVSSVPYLNFNYRLYLQKPNEQKENKNLKNETLVILEELLERTNALERMTEAISVQLQQMELKLSSILESQKIMPENSNEPLQPKKHVPQKRMRKRSHDSGEDLNDSDIESQFPYISPKIEHSVGYGLPSPKLAKSLAEREVDLSEFKGQNSFLKQLYVTEYKPRIILYRNGTRIEYRFPIFMRSNLRKLLHNELQDFLREFPKIYRIKVQLSFLLIEIDHPENHRYFRPSYNTQIFDGVISETLFNNFNKEIEPLIDGQVETYCSYINDMFSSAATIYSGVKSFLRIFGRMNFPKDLQLEITTILAIAFACNEKLGKQKIFNYYNSSSPKKFSKKYLAWCAKKFHCALKVYNGGFEEKTYFESSASTLAIQKNVFLVISRNPSECQLINRFNLFRSVLQCKKCNQIFTHQNCYYKHNAIYCPLSKYKLKKLKNNQKIVQLNEDGGKRIVVYTFAEGRWKMKASLIDKIQNILGVKFGSIENENVDIKTIDPLLKAILNLNYFCTFDIETTTPVSNLPPDTKNMRFLGRHIPLIITVARADSEEVTGFFIQSHDEIRTVLRDFVLHCLEISESFIIRKTRALLPIISKIDELIQGTRNGFERQKLISLKHKLQTHIDVMPIFGYNSRRYDLKILCNSGLIDALFLYDVDFQGKNVMPTTIKKMERYLILRSPHLLFTDCLNFEAGSAKLCDLLEQTFPNDKSLRKLQLPYQILKHGYSCFKAKIPRYEAFEDEMCYTNSLNIEFSEYQRCLNQYKMSSKEALKHLKLKAIPKTGQEKYKEIIEYWKKNNFKNFGEILWDYCVADVRPLIKFLQKRIISYYMIGNQYLHSFISISSFAFYLSFKQVMQQPEELFYIPGENLYNHIRDAICGGMVLVVTKHVELGVTKIREYKYGKEAKTAKLISAFDANSQYPSMMVQDMMVGPPIYRCATDGFKADFIKRRKLEPLRFVEYIRVTENALFMHSLANKGEISINVNEIGEVYYLDGYGVKIENGRKTPIVVEYMECMGSHGFCFTDSCVNKKHWHETNRKFINGLTMEENRKNTIIRIKNLENIYGANFKWIWGCEWLDKERHDNLAKSIVQYYTIGPTFVPGKTYTEREILSEIFDNRINGFVVTSAVVRVRSRGKFQDYPPIVKRAEITYDMLSPKMKLYVEKYKLMEGAKKRIVNVAGFFVHSRLFTTEEMRELATKYDTKFYNVTEIFQFKMSPVLRPIMEQLYNKRKEAKASGQPSLSLTCKTLMNSIFGKSLQKKTSYKNVQFVDISTDEGTKRLNKVMCSPHFVDEKQISQQICEITMRKSKVTFDLPISLAYFILLHSKRQTQNFAYDFIAKYIDESDFQILMSDTDSIFVCFGENDMAKCVPSHLKSSFETAKNELFTDDLMGWKSEIEVSNFGAYCAPTEKIYGVYKMSSGGKYYRSKFATKGISLTNIENHELFNYEHLKGIVFGDIKPPLSRSTTFRTVNSGIVTTEMTKRAMTAISFKRYLLDDGYNTIPFPNL